MVLRNLIIALCLAALVACGQATKDVSTGPASSGPVPASTSAPDPDEGTTASSSEKKPSSDEGTVAPVASQPVSTPDATPSKLPIPDVLPPSPVCGNSKVETDEVCDDGNVVNGDGCNSVCKTESCGDGIVQSGLGEECDGSNLNGSSCATFGYSMGTLSCGGTCVFNKTGCSNPPPAPVCGNGAIELGEQCDDSNAVSGDGCSSICKTESCGDTVVQSGLGEECDGSNLNGSSCSTFGYSAGSLSCSGTCKFVKTGCSAVCGNGVKEPNEQCDDHNTISGDGCSSACKTEFCGDNTVQTGLSEECDGSSLNGKSCATFGYSAGNLSCDGTCKLVKTACSTVCGNGVKETGEQCDDSNSVSGDGCSSICKTEFCGDSVIQPGIGEECDGSNLNGSSCATFGYSQGSLSCGGTCKFNKTACSNPPPAPVCGNGIKESGEQCDDNNAVSGDGCSSTCKTEICGDGVIQSGLGEECDGSNLNNSTCSTFGFSLGSLSCGGTCKFNKSGCSNPPVCGNGIKESGEQCDDSNILSGDGCSSTCKTEYCGDAIIQSGLGEECDGSNLNGSSCTTFGYSLGTLSCGGTCKFVKSGCSNPPPVPVCGNGAIESGEQCDDSNTVSNDGCSSTCKTEYCGDAVVQSGLGEECDGSNLNGSSCSTFGYTVGSLSCGGTCKFVKTGCSSVCGNGVKETGEQCDDGNTFNWDGCSATCQSEPAPTVGTNFLTSENLWNSKKQTTGSIMFGTTDASSADNAVVALMFPGVPGQGSTYKPGPANATEISTKQKLSFGTYRTRVKFATCAVTEEVVNGVFLYSYGGDTNVNGITDNNEIDFEVLCGEPRYLYITTWTDYDYNATTGVETFLKVTRTVDMTTGKVYQTKPGFENSYGNMAQVATIPDAVISNFLVGGNYYDLRLDYQNNRLRFYIMNNGKEVMLWDYTDSKYIPQNPMYFMFNVWHTGSHWWAGGSANYPANNAVMSVDYFKYWAN